MARPRIHDEERIATAVRLPRSLHEQLRAAADERQVAANLLIVKALETFLAQLTPVDQLTAPQIPNQVSQAPGTFER
ncbi:MAG: toxin-antitoxin system HicB family antitoxin [Acidimicrobiia bacterium]